LSEVHGAPAVGLTANLRKRIHMSKGNGSKEVALRADGNVVQSAAGVNSAAFWERLWRLSGINFILLFIIALVVLGHQSQLGVAADFVVAARDGERTRVFIAAVISGMAVLNLMWFAAALRTTLADAGQHGWGAATTTSSALVGGLFLLLIGVGAAVAYSIAGAAGHALAAALKDIAWAGFVLSSFPRAMLIMAGTFGLWRAGLISKPLFAAGVVAVVLVLLGGTTWSGDGLWAPEGSYSRFVSPAVGMLWIVATSQVLARSPATRTGW